MLILGFQKMTLVDFPDKVACTIFTAGCNLRCPFCHNSALVTHINQEEKYDPDDILAYLAKRKGLLDGVAITGGEPLMQPDIKDFILKIRALGYPVKLDTNGTFPDKLKELIDEKLVDYVAMDVKNTKEKYPETTGISNLDLENIEKSMKILKDGGVPYEFRTTVVKEYHTLEDISEIAKWISFSKKYFLQEFVDSGDIIKSGLHAPDKGIIDNMALSAANYLPNTKVRKL